MMHRENVFFCISIKSKHFEWWKIPKQINNLEEIFATQSTEKRLTAFINKSIQMYKLMKTTKTGVGRGERQ